MDPYGHIVARLDGGHIERDFGRYAALVKKGIAGFIVFAGELDAVREGIRELQALSEDPLIIASDLEEGLGGQVKGGTRFPSQMAVAKALSEGGLGLDVLKSVYRAVALEAAYAGINTVLTPVMDINTNPDNPIIASRAFGEDAGTVSRLGAYAIEALQAAGVNACAKHFPGHGDTVTDSHLGLPVIDKDVGSLRSVELTPFLAAINAGVRTVMLGHLSCPALEPTGAPASLSERIVRLLRAEMKFANGIIMTDALDMGGLKEAVKGKDASDAEARAAGMALMAGVDVLLHPSDAGELAAALDGLIIDLSGSDERLINFRRNHCAPGAPEEFSFDGHRALSDSVARAAITVHGKIKIRQDIRLIVLSDDPEAEDRARPFVDALKEKRIAFNIKTIGIDGPDGGPVGKPGEEVVVVVYSSVRAWKGGTAPRLRKAIASLAEQASVVVSFGNPYAIRGVQGVPKVMAYWDGEASQKGVVDLLFAG